MDKPFAKLPNVPTIMDLANQEKLSADNINALKALCRVLALGHAFVAPPGVPADRLAALRNAFKQSLAEPDFVAAAEKANLFLGYASPEDLKQMVDTSMSQSALFKPLLQAN